MKPLALLPCDAMLSDHKPGRILLVDNDPMQRLWSRRCLEDAGFVVDEAASGASAVVQVKVFRPDLVLLDVTLADLDGPQVRESLRSLAQSRDIPILLATGLNGTCLVERGYEVGATDFLRKPFSPALLVNRVKYLLRSDGLLKQLIELSAKQRAVSSALEQEVRERSRAEHKARIMALRDPLTGLANRKTFLQDLARILSGIGEGYSGVGVMFLDLDHFKYINDTYGHAVGDSVLQTVADRLRASTRSSDVVARFGGDEFAIVLPQVESAGYALCVAKRILREMNEPLFIDGVRLVARTSIGIMLTCDRSADPEQLVRKADRALYQAKDAGRGQLRIYDQVLDAKIRRSRALEDAFDGAWDRDEVIVLYQPKVTADDARLIGLEALVRWQHGNDGIIPPNEFIPMAESSGLIVPMTYWLMRSVCRQIVAWTEAGLTRCTASINVSPKVFEAQAFFEETKHILEETGIDPARLIFEITEEIAVQFPDTFAQLISKLRGLGIRMSIDDFGTGFSSIAYLRNFKVDEIKIDKAFVDDIHTSRRDAAICNTLVRLGHSLDTTVVAEGVSCHAQLDSLRDMGCDQVQGFFWAKPMPADQIPAFNARHAERIAIIGRSSSAAA